MPQHTGQSVEVGDNLGENKGQETGRRMPKQESDLGDKFYFFP